MTTLTVEPLQAPNAPLRRLRCAVYARISLDRTGEAAGVERQQDACRALIDSEGWELVGTFVDDDVSAFSGKRRDRYENLLELVRRGGLDVIVAYHPDRLYRRLSDLVELTKVVAAAGVEIRTIAAGHVDLNTASGRFTAQVLGAAAEHESARIGERVSMKHRSNAKAGKAHGGARSYGYQRHTIANGFREDIKGRIEIVPAEAEALKEAARRILAGATLASIVVDFNERGIPAAAGGKWRSSSLSLVLRSARIAGLREADGEIIGDGDWDEILDRATWERVRSRITHAPIGRRPARNLLAGMCVCVNVRPDDTVCNTTMGVLSEDPNKALKPGQRPPRRMIACDKANRHGCGSNTVKADPVEALVIRDVLEALQHVNLAQAQARRDVTASAELVDAIADDEQMLTDLAADHGEKRISRAEWLAAADPIRKRLAEARRRLDQMTAAADPHLVGLDGDVLRGITPEQFRTELTLDQQRALTRLFVDRVEIRKGRPGRTFDSERVQIVATEAG